MCYTYNNYPQGMAQYLEQEVNNVDGNGWLGGYFQWPTWESITGSSNEDDDSNAKEKLRKAQIGKYSGLQLIIDNQAMNNLIPRDVRSNGYHVYITTPGVVSSPLSFYVHPEFDGEHNFYIHGIHSISVSKIDTLRIIMMNRIRVLKFSKYCNCCIFISRHQMSSKYGTNERSSATFPKRKTSLISDTTPKTIA